ncbi:MarR family winged helix-turn-helix transcriptional regulator [Algoriphagus namhaensis]|uniref:MarR family winged helix-turn-helix transcriptional regulator n=1 Tax=Algoriphagus namhaensis TaxID=915353 RepID=A0ABV8ATK4_9BACT
MDYTLLKKIIELVEIYQEGHSSQKVEDFTIWLNNTLFSANSGDEHSTHDELVLAFKLMFLNKELKKQTKSILLKSAISSIDEYSFLLHLDYQESFRKMEIVEMHNLEAPTGIEIIKRLLKNKLIEEFPDNEDKRAKRIKITNKGKAELKTIKPKIDLIFSKFSEPLKLNERIQFSGILDKLIK